MNGIDVSLLDPDDLAAFTARGNWLASARKKQLLPPGDWDTCIWIAGRFFGKALALDTPIATATGWTTMGSISVGESVFDENGAPCRVVAVWPVMHDRPCYKLTFNGGAEIVADEDHEWLTWDKAARKAHARSDRPTMHPAIRTTGEIAKRVMVDCGQEFNHSIPCAGPLQTDECDLPVPPYSLGYWLGDGDSRDPIITIDETDREEVTRYFEADGYVVSGVTHDQRRANVCRVAFCASVKQRSAKDRPNRKFSPAGTLSGDLRQAGVLNDKHIPPVYLRACERDRRALLAGIMDSDGHMHTKMGYAEFTSNILRLALGVMELATSLGLKPSLYEATARINGKDCGQYWRVCWMQRERSAFRLERKRSVKPQKRGDGRYGNHRRIMSVERINSVPVRCITVDSPSSLYLAGSAMIPTHNTRCVVEPSWWEAYRVPGIRVHALAPTLGDVRRTMFEGESGFLAKIPPEIVKAYNKTDKEIVFKNGSRIAGFACVEEADRLRGPQCHMLVFDEAAAADRPAGNLEAAYRVAVLGCRLPMPDGSASRKLIATTPRPIPFLKRLIKRPGVIVVHGTSHENLKNVSQTVRRELLTLEGTTYGKQEIYGQFIDEESDQSIIKRNWINLWPAGKKLPEFMFILEAYDTATSEENFNVKTQTTDPSGSIVLGVFNAAAAFTPEERKKLRIRGRYGALLCEAWTERLGFPELLEKARTQHRVKWGTPGRKADVVLIEDKSSGPSLRQTLGTFGVPCWPYNPHRMDKAQRLHAASPLIHQGVLFVPESLRVDRKGMPRDWVEPFLEQVCAYAGKGSVEHDEYVDCLSMSLAYLKDRNLLEATPEEKFLDHEEKLAHDRAEAEMAGRREQKKRAGNPYG